MGKSLALKAPEGLDFKGFIRALAAVPASALKPPKQRKRKKARARNTSA